mmetsp:Transcript_12006/g.19921  ORF Transcript_12006/g.19921 Transcript_12006/m.19921 type:complete len:199 (-) Transcript_12006:181-777(-)|eukprot:CAMPEP_0119013950 /NCGR_PEP_ID=MMETSP1176-20130426/9274_1 /TAXON_ID=265551 /ORGANISM="Synedropsis recta cf, Strain CCMP1620" /LENGTH=198 /DNA_ID=CAMNT_0006967081 /DNA_START=96 /DNA_END=692 /DNA_ORIENTATION=+
MNAAKVLGSRGLGSWRVGSTRLFFRVNGSNVGAVSTAPCTIQRRFYTPMSTEEEGEEKGRVAELSPVQKASELKGMDRELALLNMKRGINTGELYTLRGKFKALARDYGMPFMAWYWTVWFTTATMVYGGIELGGIDALELLGKVDDFTGWTISDHVDHTVGTIGLTIAINEMLEPLRLPIVVLTTKPVVDTLFPSNL